jgi:hypothetical protein
MTPFCPGCRRPADRCVCDDPAEPRGSRAPEGHVAIDPLFHEAAASGFEPLSDEARESFREKAGIFRKVVGGGR